MRFGDLDHMPLAEFVASAPQEALWFFVHVPKTAGSSFSAELEQTVRPYRNVAVNYSEQRRHGPQAMVDAVDDFIALSDFEQHRSASGHMPYHVSGRLSDVRPGTQFFSILRSPLARIVSTYRYQRTPQHPPHQEFIKAFPTLTDYVEHVPHQNEMTFFLTGKRFPKAQDALQIVDEEYAFIGLLEMYPMSFNVLFSLMDHPEKMPVEHLRRTPDTEETRVEMTPQLEQRIKEANAVDVALYEHVHKRLLRHREAWRVMHQARVEAARGAGVVQAG